MKQEALEAMKRLDEYVNRTNYFGDIAIDIAIVLHELMEELKRGKEWPKWTKVIKNGSVLAVTKWHNHNSWTEYHQDGTKNAIDNSDYATYPANETPIPEAKALALIEKWKQERKVKKPAITYPCWELHKNGWLRYWRKEGDHDVYYTYDVVDKNCDCGTLTPMYAIIPEGRARELLGDRFPEKKVPLSEMKPGQHAIDCCGNEIIRSKSANGFFRLSDYNYVGVNYPDKVLFSLLPDTPTLTVAEVDEIANQFLHDSKCAEYVPGVYKLRNAIKARLEAGK